MAASVFVLVGTIAGGVAIADERGRSGSGGRQDIRTRVRARYRAHPTALQLQFACLSIAAVLLVIAGVILVWFYT
jgi:hypothetical protein